MEEKLKQLTNELLEIVKYVSKNSEETQKTFTSINNALNKNMMQFMRQETINAIMVNEDLIHVSTQKYNNAGDVILSCMVKKIIEYGMARNVDWADVSIGTAFDTIEAKASNKNKGIVVGGGGLLFDRDISQTNSWQWNISSDAIDKLKIPMFLFAVGYNQFRNQGDMRNGFRDDINRIAEKCGFIGLRNHGSIEAVKKYLDPKYYEKLVYQPCPTTMISKMYDCSQEDEKDIIAVNMAFDRQELRFGSEENLIRIISSTINVIEKLSEEWNILFYSHLPGDEMFVQIMEEQGVKLDVVRLYDIKNPFEMIELYKKPKLVIGMRGHAQMVPFGCGVPIVSIISHDKMKWFLEDIGCDDWGVDVLEPNYEEQLMQTVQNVLNNYDMVKDKILTIQDSLWEISMNNIKFMKELIDN